ncbi:MAG: hypothetical protein ACRDP1_10950, partial [Nocardioidaceae bacterium]
MTLAEVKAPPSPAPLVSRSSSRLVRWCDVGVDACLLAFATWTVVYHLCLVLRLGVTWAVGLAVAALVAFGAVLVRRRRILGQPAPSGEPDPDRVPGPRAASVSDQPDPAVEAAATPAGSRRFDRYLVPAACLFTGAAALLMAFG